jgi:pyruvate dehydrogenase E2 component (dihydrolipoamide acetyltransferase)
MRATAAAPRHGAVRLLGSGTILREVIAAAELLAADWRWPARCGAHQLQRTGARGTRGGALEPAASRGRRRASATWKRCLAGDAPVIAATDYVRAWPQLIAPYVDAPLHRARHRRLRPQRHAHRTAPLLRGGSTANAAPAAAPASVPEAALAAAVPPTPPPDPVTVALPVVAAAPAAASAAIASGGKAHATPSLRHFARVLGVDLSQVPGTGVKGRIQKQDVEGYVKGMLTRGAAAPSAPAAGGLDLLPWPEIDFTRFGPIETRPLSRIEKISGANLHRNWVLIPHVTNNDEADITELEAFRVQLNGELAASGVKISMLTFLIKAAAAALKKFPKFNASLDGQGDDAQLVLKKYFNIGFAADTPNGLMVPVIRDADRKGLVEIAREVLALAQTAREGKLKPDQMQGGCFSISSLGGVGGTSFTPIINAPEVAIMGISKAAMKPVWDGAGFVPRLILPLSLSWDHRVINGVDAASFNVYFASLLADMRRAML